MSLSLTAEVADENAVEVAVVAVVGARVAVLAVAVAAVRVGSTPKGP